MAPLATNTTDHIALQCVSLRLVGTRVGLGQNVAIVRGEVARSAS